MKEINQEQVKNSKRPCDFVDEGVLLVESGMRSSVAARTICEREGNIFNEDSLRRLITKKIGNKPEVESLKSEVKSVNPKTESDKKNKKSEPKEFVLSAWNFDTGMMMGIEDYCAHYNLPIDNVINYRLVTHTGTPFYNTSFKDVFKLSNLVSEDFLEGLIKRFIKPVDYSPGFTPFVEQGDWFDKLTYSDCHIGMDTDKEGIAMYPTPWNMAEQLRRVKLMAECVVLNRKGNILFIDELGDFMDGYNGYTVRQGHHLPQNMSNEQCFDVGMTFKMSLIDSLVPFYDQIHIHHICNDNHSGSFGYMVNSAVKQICQLKYPEKVEITNQRSFLNHYFVGRHAFVNTHGKDGKNLKFGFKPHLDAKQVEKIDGYLKYNKIYNKAEFIDFSKGDSHQMLFDYCTSDDFNYFNFPAFSPSSEWVQTNFKKSRSGFVLQHIKYNENVGVVKPIWF